MKSIDIKDAIKTRAAGWLIIAGGTALLLYFLAAIFFSNHFFFNTIINGADVSLRSHKEVSSIIRDYIEKYSLQLIERDGGYEKISSREIELQYNEKNSIPQVLRLQNSFNWLSPLFKSQNYYVNDMFIINASKLNSRIEELNCLNKVITESQNVGFKYTSGTYEVVKEIYGNRINRDRLHGAINLAISRGERKLDLVKSHCYEDPKYTLSSKKVPETRSLLNKYVSTKITYIFEDEREVLDGSIINSWFIVDENLDVTINKKCVYEYLVSLSKKYDTVGIARKFKTSLGKIIEVKGGLYGWKIDKIAETRALMENIRLGETIEKEPVFSQRSLPRGEGEIGSTYVEINITKQYLWFYKEGRLIARGGVVTGNPNRGYSTVTGTYMLNYKDENVTLVGPGYEAEVTYWMPFFGNIGIHDATWRYSFGGQIYKKNGTHGCVNVPIHLARTIFDNIEPGTPIISYNE